MFERGSKKHII